uniref:5-oxoprolinase n=2 Tax=Pinguiococcus pyrenoidosus TaxID=172671 RepID=A0A7R9U1M2_9STRA|mmetsp:Transcript_10721/g.40280  ORF Transcript_10721/g.40280 Transcript_10721/m.40280 type:complete len:1352 (+) Transcript_10721:123-4178(+)
MYSFSIDRGGTFTDCFCTLPDGRVRVLKLLSEDPERYADAPREAIRRVLEEETGRRLPREDKLDTSLIEEIRMGTTVATNALLEHRGERCALLITRGFKDLLLIGNQSRPDIFDLRIAKPEVPCALVLEVDERVVLEQEGLGAPAGYPQPSTSSEAETVVGITGQRLVVEEPLDDEQVRQALRVAKDEGLRSIAVCLMHSYAFADHERRIKDVATEMGFEHISLSCEVAPMVKIVPRATTTCVDAYLTPVLQRYVESFRSGFSDLSKTKVHFMQSDGGLIPAEGFMGHRSILSGPAGGVVGYAICGERDLQDAPRVSEAFTASGDAKVQPIIGFDMGGTSTDVSRYEGSFEHVFETRTANQIIYGAQLDVNTVAAGGGSRLFYKDGIFKVGPQSAGAHPGPICYRKNGFLTVTDANLVLGRILPQYFPKIFGPDENEALDAEGARAALSSLTDAINEEGRRLSGSSYTDKTVDEVAMGFITVANEAMCRPVRNLTTMRGFDVTTHALSCFGGAGPQHCCGIAKNLGIQKVLIDVHAGILSAVGIAKADVVYEFQEAASATLESAAPDLAESLVEKAANLGDKGARKLLDAGIPPDAINLELFLNLRYQGTDTAIMTSMAAGDEARVRNAQDLRELLQSGVSARFVSAFKASYQREFGFDLENRAINVDDVRVRAIGKSMGSSPAPADGRGASPKAPVADAVHSAFFAETGRVDVPVYKLEAIDVGSSLSGPCIVVQNISTIVVEPHCRAFMLPSRSIAIEVAAEKKQLRDEARPRGLTASSLDPILLSIFSHRFMSIAEQMGKVLQRTSISVNIKERLDFSCAVFDKTGGLVANAPHLPVHLGAMPSAVRFQAKYWGEKLRPGDVLMSNHPQLAGGSHLPDITVITPVFDETGTGILFFVASRGHHADVGGIAPGSMPPDSTTIEDEGAAIVAFKLVEGGAFQDAGARRLLLAPGEREGNSGARKVEDNISDLKAQVAANQRGVHLMRALMEEYGLDTVQDYMLYIQDNAERSVRRMLHDFSLNRGMAERDRVAAEDYMDDGTRIALEVTISRNGGPTETSAVFDFSATDPEVVGNTNAPPAVTASAVIYCLRCLLPASDLPLNQGCLNPVEIITRPGTLLNPSPSAAVVGGNVLTSQRVTDVVLRTFEACAASQGCMGNLTFGDDALGYYETIAGGAGAGPGWHGASGVHTHMTNTRITDPEILETHFPVILRAFGLRTGSGGLGRWRGGDGCTRIFQWRRPLTVSILTERRSLPPYGMKGGGSGTRGKNLWHRLLGHPDGSREYKAFNVGPKRTFRVGRGDVLEIQTPGGGGYERRTDETEEMERLAENWMAFVAGGSLQRFQDASLSS